MSPRSKGILLMVLAGAMFSLLDSQAKEAIQTLPVSVVVFFRYLIAVFMAAAVLWRTGTPQLFLTRHPALQVLRGLLLLMSTGLNFLALQYLQLAQTSAIAFTVPLWVCALSVPLLGERVGLQRWTAVIVGFLGVLVIMRPGTGSFHWAMFMSLASALASALYNIVTRKVGGRDRAETSLFYVSLFGAMFAAMPLHFQWQVPHGWQWLQLCGIALAGSLGHFSLIQAHRLAPASVLAPFSYTQIVSMIFMGYLLFGDLPDFWTLVGAAIVVASGLFVFMREQVLAQRKRA